MKFINKILKGINMPNCHNMSKDRISFLLTDEGFTDSDYRDMITQVFGVDHQTFKDSAVFCRTNNRWVLAVTCRPSQFGRFIVLRNDLDINQNLIKKLKPRLFRPEESTNSGKVDVSKRRTNYGARL